MALGMTLPPTSLLKFRHQAIRPRVDHNKINHRCIYAPTPVSCILFGAAHAAIYANHLRWWAFLLVTPQFVLGVLLASIRVRFGLRWSIATHYAIDSLLAYGAWMYLAAAHESVLQQGLMLVYLVIGAFVMIYGLVALVRVARGRW